MPIAIGTTDLISILPIAIVSLFGVYLLLQSVFAPRMNRILIPYLGILGVGLAVVGNFFLIGMEGTAFEGMVRVDRLTVVLNFLFLITAALSLLITISYH